MTGYPPGRPRITTEERARREAERQRLALVVREAMAQLGTTRALRQEDLAGLLGVSRSLVGRWARAEKRPTPTQIEQIQRLVQEKRGANLA
jgi:transcriptional regulator with XRE-family HTH domain